VTIARRAHALTLTFDLLNTIGLTQEQVTKRLVAAFCGCLHGWENVM